MNLAKTLTRTLSRTMSTSARPSSSLIPTISTLPDLRAWRQRAFKEDKSVGVVPTMGALHEGHLDLGKPLVINIFYVLSRKSRLITQHHRTSPVRHSLRANPLTVLTLFVNPTQFAPHEDLSSYPRTLPRDLKLLENLLRSEYPGKEMDKLVVWTPSRETMYPLSSLPAPASGSTGESMLQDVNKQRGAFVEVKGWGDVLEGASRRESRLQFAFH
jgi:pantoate--beta-alanine ligase